ncbi:unnamed protein product [Prorocentrum cordatum]|uniref:Uncharacterized protein n=1 Tax=Prorocentrum cordatum TaxID=2364126 RepID=A0ABN9RFF7_9DINO|nr:unnamed protein product [Polarella glacialis]
MRSQTQPRQRVTMSLALIYGVGANLQVMHQSTQTHIVQPRTGCRTAVAGDDCYIRTSWAMQTGVLTFPDLFFPLTNQSSFEDFQRHLHGMARFAKVCPEPCAARAPDMSAPEQVPASDSCHAPVVGDECHKRVVWAMKTGVVKYLDQFSPLTSSSSFEDFQRHLHGIANSPTCALSLAQRGQQRF